MPEGEKSFEQAVSILPDPLHSRVMGLDAGQKARAEEVRLRVGRQPTLTLPEGEWAIPGAESVQPELLDQIIRRASGWSVHTVMEQIRQGYLTTQGGHRLGICGTAVMEEGQIRTLRDVSSLNLRVARQMRGIGEGVVSQLRKNGQLRSTLILAPPGRGKTTLLRDLIRCVSLGHGGTAARVAVVDERGELAACCRGIPQMELGPCTDVLEGCTKAEGIQLLLRGMNPQVIAVDEITAPEDVLAMERAVGCGAALLATAHGSGMKDLRRRPVYRDMVSKGIFQLVILIGLEEGRRAVQVRELEDVCT